MKDLNVPAFPLNTPRWHEELNQQGWLGGDFTTGMTLRDYFAAKAMQGFAANVGPAVTFESRAMTAYQWADAMLKAREA